MQLRRGCVKSGCYMKVCLGMICTFSVKARNVSMNCLEGVKARNPKQINARAFAGVQLVSLVPCYFDFSRWRSSLNEVLYL